MIQRLPKDRQSGQDQNQRDDTAASHEFRDTIQETILSPTLSLYSCAHGVLGVFALLLPGSSRAEAPVDSLTRPLENDLGFPKPMPG